MGKMEKFTSMATMFLDTKHSLVASSTSYIRNDEAMLEVEYFHNDEDIDFLVSSPRERLSILHGIANQNASVSLHCENSRNVVLSTILGVNENGIWMNAVQMSQSDMSHLLSEKIVFVSMHQHVKIQFDVQNIVIDRLGSKQTIFMRLPDYLLRIQRREFFRSVIPSTDLARCIIPVQPENAEDQIILRTAPLVDISAGGVRILLDEDDAKLLSNKTFSDCQISLPDVGTLTVTIEVCNSADYTTHNVIQKRVGCRFVNLDGQKNILLQRHINHLQSESLAKRHLSTQEMCV